MAAEYVTKIRTVDGDLPVDYNSLWGKPSSDTELKTAGAFADAKVVGDKIKTIDAKIKELDTNSVSGSTTINGKPLSSNITLSASDIGAATEKHEHSMSDITSGVVPMERGGTNAESGKDGLKNLLADGYMILSDYQYGNAVPPIPEKQEDKEKMRGRIFFVKVQ